MEVSISKRNTAEVAVNSLNKMFAAHGLPFTVTSDNGCHFVAEAFETFLKQNGIEHRKTTPLWPQANGEVERQNRSLLKRMQIAQVEKGDWKEAVLTYLVAYRNTPHPSTGVCPSEMLFGRKLRTKQPRVNKWTTQFESQPHELIDRCGSSVVIKSPEGSQYRRNTSHVKLYHEREKPNSAEKSAPKVEVGDVADDLGEIQQTQKDVADQRDSTPVKSPRPVRTRHLPNLPKRFEDFVLE